MIIVAIRAGLGNQMFQYAYARALQEYTGAEVKIETRVLARDKSKPGNIYRPYGLKNFKITLKETNLIKEPDYKYLFSNSLFDRCRTFLSKKHIYPYKYYDFSMCFYRKKHLKIKSNCVVLGFFQDERYFINIRKKLLKEFQPKEKILLSKSLHEILDQKEVVSLHVRRGDYKIYNNIISPQYYANAVNYIKSKFKSPVFLVFSDDLEWVKHNIKIDANLYYIDDFADYCDYEQLFLMSRCKHNIISNSTFSWWAGWLNQNLDKIVIAPGKWFPMQENIIPNGWIQM